LVVAVLLINIADGPARFLAKRAFLILIMELGKFSDADKERLPLLSVNVKFSIANVALFISNDPKLLVIAKFFIFTLEFLL